MSVIVQTQQPIVPVLSIMAAAMLLLIIIYHKWAPVEQEKRKKVIGVQTGNTQWIGRQEVKKEYFSVISYKGKHFAALAYGLGREKNSTLASVITVDIFKTNFYKKVDRCQNMKEYVVHSIKQIEKNLLDTMWANNRQTAFLVFVIENGLLEFAFRGHCYLLLYRKGNLITVCGDIYGMSGLQTGRKKLQKGDKLLLMGQGAYKGLTEMEILEAMKSQDTAQEKCEILLRKVREKQFIYQENATFIMMENF